MKKTVLGLFIALAFCITNVATAVTPDEPASANQSTGMPSSVIDGIEVPFEVLDYAQMKYQGYAVIGAARGFSGGQPVYLIFVDNEDVQRDGNSMVLTYDLKWNLLSDQKRSAPVYVRPIAPQTPKNEDTPEEPERPRQDRPERPEPREPDFEDEQEPEGPPDNEGPGNGWPGRGRRPRTP